MQNIYAYDNHPDILNSLSGSMVNDGHDSNLEQDADAAYPFIQ